ncbi:Uncharacterised protein [Mycobacteroides abscessus subsp. massiliense]|nr:Uncharacterised protein [Mycobacteroides abscessus subsp. massiliense]
MTLDHLTVGGHALARAHHELVAHRELVDGNARLVSPSQHRDVLGPQRQQSAQRRACRALGAGFGEPAREQEDGDRGHHFEVHVNIAVGVSGIGEQHPQRPQVRGDGAQ